MYKYYEVERDKLYIGKYDINDYTLKDIRNNITYISQNELLYTDTIKNNIIPIFFINNTSSNFFIFTSK